MSVGGVGIRRTARSRPGQRSGDQLTHCVPRSGGRLGSCLGRAGPCQAVASPRSRGVAERARRADTQFSSTALAGCPGPRLGDPAVGDLARPVGAEVWTGGAWVRLGKAGGRCPLLAAPGASAARKPGTIRAPSAEDRAEAEARRPERGHRRWEPRMPAGRWSGPRSWEPLAPALNLESLGGGSSRAATERSALQESARGPGWETGLQGKGGGATGPGAGEGKGTRLPRALEILDSSSRALRASCTGPFSPDTLEAP